ncbi:MAG: hypothetical protein IKZ34_03250 [Alphaproteobacteria bacterium]|nr:hypothetical protein [Alphaproteobacteria bacterium]
MQKFLSISDSSVKERIEMSPEYDVYLKKHWGEARKKQMRAWKELKDKVIVFHVK